MTVLGHDFLYEEFGSFDPKKSENYLRFSFKAYD